MMSIKSYDELNSTQIDVLKEIGSVGAGNAATALSQSIDQKIKITVPTVKILNYNAAVKFLGQPELLVFGELVKMSGEISGTLLYLQSLEFANTVLRNTLKKTITSFEELTELDQSALTEIGNIIISAYINAISSLADMDIHLSVPAVSIDMLGSIAAVPMIEYGYENNKIMIIDVSFICDEETVPSSLILVPDVSSLNQLLEKLGISCE